MVRTQGEPIDLTIDDENDNQVPELPRIIRLPYSGLELQQGHVYKGIRAKISDDFEILASVARPKTNLHCKLKQCAVVAASAGGNLLLDSYKREWSKAINQTINNASEDVKEFDQFLDKNVHFQCDIDRFIDIVETTEKRLATAEKARDDIKALMEDLKELRKGI